jgi:cytoskeletal protein CcmA (bactofilin family)
LVGEEAYFHGILSPKGSLRVEGTIEGDITDAVSVEVGSKGRVKGNIVAESLSIAGEVQGDIVASSHVELLASARFNGNIRTPSLKVEEGAAFNGHCAMGTSSQAKERSVEILQPRLAASPHS